MNGLQLEFEPNTKQYEAILRWQDATTVEIVYGGAKYGGKSFLGSALIFHDALVYPDTHYFIARAELNDLRKYTLPTIFEVFQNWKIEFSKYARYNGQDNYFSLYNKSRVYLLECKRIPGDPLYERFGSMQMTRGWIEEAGEVEALAKENLKLSLGRKNNDRYNLPPKLLQTCNPKKNYLYMDFYLPWIEGKLPPDKAFIQALPDDNTHGNQDYIKSLKETRDKVMRERLVLGNWEYDDDPNALIPYECIAAIFSNDHVKGTGVKYITADVARFGKDKTIIRVWDGFKVLERVVITGSKVTDTAARIRQVAAKHGVPMMRVLVDEDGIGGGVVDILSCKGFVAGSSPVNPRPGENYKNLKGQCAFRLAELVNAAVIYEPSASEEEKKLLIADLEQIKQDQVDHDTKRGVVSKEKVKTILGRSPDDGDSYVMRAWFEVRGASGPSLIKPDPTRTSNGRNEYNM